MQLLRMIVAKFESLSIGDWTEKTLTFGLLPVEMFAKGFDATGLDVYLTCQCPLSSYPSSNGDGDLEPQDDVRRHLEEQLELAVNAVSVATRSRRSIRSVDPCVAFIPESDAERVWLDAHRGIARGQFAHPHGHPRISFSVIQQLCADRADGIALMSEAIAHPHPSGRFHELFRVFERAFKTACGQLSTPLSKFLAPNGCGYTPDEIKKWIDLRGPLTHADRRPAFLLERDAAPVVHRMEQAAIDVLVNKQLWRDSSTAREQRWRPQFGSSDAGAGVFVMKDLGAELKFDIMDQFGVYPLDLKYRLELAPAGWWTGQIIAREAKVDAFPGASIIDAGMNIE
ncbi:MAG TPA: hypothetical protein VGY55_04620 [Pirellulales bacterium]|jgi:hypothetical protein|nr:hypothetical protein [Pirellulales bacterium]